MDAETRAEMIEALRNLLSSGFAGTQEEICQALAERGFELNQSTVSRALRKVGAIKSMDGERVAYRLGEVRTASYTGSVRDLVVSMAMNETMIVMRTVPGSASFVGEYLDHADMKGVLGSIAGDDTLFISPKSVEDISNTMDEVKQALKGR